MTELRKAAPWQTTSWFNTTEPLALAALRGRVILLHAFQMLCPACVSRGLPQAQRISDLFAGSALTVVGLHTVFEHHRAMEPHALAAFLREYRIDFPVGVDAPGPSGDGEPLTMRAYGMQGTPTAVLIDQDGLIRHQRFGVDDDLLLGAAIGALLERDDAGCVDDVCRAPPLRLGNVRAR